MWVRRFGDGDSRKAASLLTYLLNYELVQRRGSCGRGLHTYIQLQLYSLQIQHAVYSSAVGSRGHIMLHGHVTLPIRIGTTIIHSFHLHSIHFV